MLQDEQPAQQAHMHNMTNMILLGFFPPLVCPTAACSCNQAHFQEASHEPMSLLIPITSRQQQKQLQLRFCPAQIVQPLDYSSQNG